MRGRFLRILRTLWIAAGLSFALWLYLGVQASGVPDEAVESDRYVTVARTDRALEFRPLVNRRNAGMIFLPGAMVEPTAYAPLLKKVAAAGYSTHLVYLPMRCAFTESQVRQLFRAIHEVMASEPKTTWVLAGHSRGGMLAARFLHENRTGLAGLALIGTTHPRDFSLAGVTMPVAKIYGTRDGVASFDKIRQNRHLLPPDTTWVEIEGGNHVQFGYYRHQLGDGDATISRAEQQKRLETALLAALSHAAMR